MVGVEVVVSSSSSRDEVVVRDVEVEVRLVVVGVVVVRPVVEVRPVVVVVRAAPVTVDRV